MKTTTCSLIAMVSGLAGLACMVVTDGTARASIAYGSINNFDTVNDTGSMSRFRD